MLTRLQGFNKESDVLVYLMDEMERNNTFAKVVCRKVWDMTASGKPNTAVKLIEPLCLKFVNKIADKLERFVLNEVDSLMQVRDSRFLKQCSKILAHGIVNELKKNPLNYEKYLTEEQKVELETIVEDNGKRKFLQMMRHSFTKKTAYSPVVKRELRKSLKRYKEDNALIKHQMKGLKAELANVVRELKPLKKDYPTIRKLNTVLRSNSLVRNFIKKFGLERGSYSDYATSLIGHYILGKIKNKTFYDKMVVWARNNLQELLIDLKRQDSPLPTEFYEFLPSSSTIELDVAGNLQGVVEHFATQKKTIQTKMVILVDMVKNWNKIVRKVERDFQGSDSRKKLLALMTMIMMNTGIRPGAKIGKVKVKDDNGNVTEVETFGVTTLRIGHIKMIRDEFNKASSAKLEFVGKKGTTNLADISNKDIAESLDDLMRGRGKNENVFITNDGKTVDYAVLSRYVNKLGYDTTDFRKYVASLTMFKELKERSKEMYVALKRISKDKEETQFKDAVKIITNTIREAGLAVAKKLNHDERDQAVVAINSYCSPSVVLRFLSDGGLRGDIQKAIDLGNNLEVKFNLQAFFNQAETVLASPSVQVKVVEEKVGLDDLAMDFKDLYEDIDL